VYGSDHLLTFESAHVSDYNDIVRISICLSFVLRLDYITKTEISSTNCATCVTLWFCFCSSAHWMPTMQGGSTTSEVHSCKLNRALGMYLSCLIPIPYWESLRMKRVLRIVSKWHRLLR